MPTVHTIAGHKRRRRSGGGGRTAQQRKFAAAAKSCAGKSKGAFRSCMRAKLRR